MERFPAKILLFGEYGLVAGGSGLAIPYTKFGGSFKMIEGQAGTVMSVSNQNLKRLFAYLMSRNSDFGFFNLARFERDIKEGLWFDSNIPRAYGLGSSGALVAALYHRYAEDKTASHVEIRQHLASIESFFHGSSSGTDPLVSYLQTPLVLHSNDRIETMYSWTVDALKIKVFLVDTGEKSKTLSLVEWFRAQLLKPDFKEATENELLAVNENIISAIQQGKAINTAELKTLSRYQNDYLYPMIPDAFHQHFMAGLKSGAFLFKLCGSGGGGFMLCFAIDEQAAINYFEAKGLTYDYLSSI